VFGLKGIRPAGNGDGDSLAYTFYSSNPAAFSSNFNWIKNYISSDKKAYPVVVWNCHSYTDESGMFPEYFASLGVICQPVDIDPCAPLGSNHLTFPCKYVNGQSFLPLFIFGFESKAYYQADMFINMDTQFIFDASLMCSLVADTSQPYHPLGGFRVKTQQALAAFVTAKMTNLAAKNGSDVSVYAKQKTALHVFGLHYRDYAPDQKLLFDSRPCEVFSMPLYT
jgi:hypothetical protein